MKKQMRPLTRVSLLVLPLVLAAGLAAQRSTFAEDPSQAEKDLAEQISRLVETQKISDLSKLAIPHDAQTAQLRAWTTAYIASINSQRAERDKEFGDEVGKAQAQLKDQKYDKALEHAVAAFEIASDLKDQADFLQFGWVKDLTGKAADEAAALEKRGQWIESYQLYSDLNTLYEIDTRYKADMQRLERRIRLLAMYTPQTLFDMRKALAARQQKETESEHPTTAPAKSTSAPGASGSIVPKQLAPGTPAPPPLVEDSTNFPKWRDQVEGIKLDMVEDVIKTSENNWVYPVTYTTLVKGGVEALRLFLTTPELAKEFPGLADKAARAQFDKALDDALAKTAAAQNPTASDVDAVVRGLMDASNSSVKLDERVVLMEFTDGAMEKLDPFTAVIWPHELQEFQKGTTGAFGGVGIQISVGAGAENGQLKVVSPLPDSPALDAGIYAGDVIVAIDHKPTIKMSIDDAVHTITGTPGTDVVLTIKRKGVPDKDYTLTRALIKVASVMGFKRDATDTTKWNYMIDPESKIGYIRLTQFQSDSAQQLRNTLVELQNEGVRGIIMDLRFNPGGLLPAAINISDMFLQNGPIVSTRGRSVSGERWTAKDDPVIPMTMPLVVMVNQYSASASEIYTGAMKDHHRGVIVGHRSFGKGSVQHLLQMGPETLPDGSPVCMMKLTMAHYYLPNNESLHRNDGSKVWGVDPDVPVEMTPNQMNDLREGWHDAEIIHRPGEPAQTQPAATTKKVPFDDTQLDTALMMMRLQLLQEPPVQPGPG